MKTEKYKLLIQQRILQTIEEWTLQEIVEEHELHRFFHNLKGTSGTIGLMEMERFSASKESLFVEKSVRTLTCSEWSEHVVPLTNMFNSEMIHNEPPAETVKAAALKPKSSQDSSLDQKRVLVIDDDVDFVTYVKEVLEKNDYQVSIGLTAERGLKLFYQWKPCLLLLDIVLPDQSGMEVLNQIVEKAKLEHIPIIMVSGNFSVENQISAYRSGAMDFLAKPFDVALLTALIDNRFMMKVDWERSITLDELTGAYNRKHFNDVMRHQIQAYEQRQDVFSLVMLDLDHFKHVNDSYGHLKGDEVLQAFAASARNIFQNKGIFCRYGGEEFALVLPHLDSVQAANLLDQLRRQFNAINFVSKDETFQVTFSSGITQISGSVTQAEKLVDQADQALYAAKRGGRNQTIVYSMDISEHKTESSLNLIVVDDDPLIRDILISRFADWKPTSQTTVKAYGFEDGKTFLSSDWYREGEKYIILLDGSMPELDGLDVLRELRRSFPEQQLLIVMLTARNQPEDIIQALEIGADDYVIKPFHMQELMLRIERLASRIVSE
ncbi:GGDEF domain-containing response regulator [Paenibacillus sinopodophylli]|uniref:GGDEF domain-containing response regulator n=1 Tax=Paenibacillus sinopodophylli TaxID=1837342 RepID=UPI00110CE2AB|nr:diguanylate cyclase [Paenibacillus sinopodophylli]